MSSASEYVGSRVGERRADVCCNTSAVGKPIGVGDCNVEDSFGDHVDDCDVGDSSGNCVGEVVVGGSADDCHGDCVVGSSVGDCVGTYYEVGKSPKPNYSGTGGMNNSRCV